MPHVTVGKENGANIDISRRRFLVNTAGLVAVTGLPMSALAAKATPANSAASQTKIKNEKGKQDMNTITTKDGTQLYYKDWGKGQPIVFSHGWPLSADAFEDQMFFLAERGYRCIAHDRRDYAGDGKVGIESCWHTDRRVRQTPCRRPGRSLAVLEGAQHAVLWLQSAGHENFRRGARIVLAPGNDVRLSRRLFLHQSVFRNGPDGRSQEI